jgi:hypothetical protein
MYKELKSSEINISHHLSKRLNTKNNEKNKNYDNDLFMSSKIELRFNVSRGV